MQHAEILDGSPTLSNWHPYRPEVDGQPLRERAVIDCGWGRLIFGHTFRQPADLTAEILREAPGKRDIALYIRDPHVILSLAPQELFLDPSHTYRLALDELKPATPAPGFSIRSIRSAADAEGAAAVWRHCQMVPAPPDFIQQHGDNPALIWLVAVDDSTGQVIGSVTGVGHVEAFADPENGSSLWSLATDPRAAVCGVGEALATALARRFASRGRAYMDLSVLHDNAGAIGLYETLGFRRVPVFCIKRKNSINEALFVGEAGFGALNPYTRIITDEARRRGIAVEVVDASGGYFKLRQGGRSILCRESLSALTPATAMSLCDNKQATRRVLSAAGLRLPDQIAAGDGGQADFLCRHTRVVVKPARGEQGQGVSVDLTGPDQVAQAIDRARHYSDQVLIEEFVEGDDLRVVVIGGEVVAAAIRRPAQIRGTGRHRIRRLIEKQSRRRAAATGGESRIPLDDETRRCVAAAGHSLDDILPAGETLTVRKSANLHTGGTIHDVTSELHPLLAEVSRQAAAELDIPVVRLDLLVTAPDQPDYVIIEANERPGLANHEPQPTAQRFVDLLFPATARADRQPDPAGAAAG